jgi:L-malate glycosyltransferase
VFIVPSEYEGWGLPGSEAMCCGAALVSTRNGGVDAYAIDDETACLVDPGRPNQIADAVVKLLEHERYRRVIATKGNSHIRRFTWEESLACMSLALASGGES